MIAVLQPDSWNWLLLVHLLAAIAARRRRAHRRAGLARRRAEAWPEQVPLLRAIAFRTNLVVVLPGFIAVHVFGDLLANREFKHGDPDWLCTGFAITDIALIVGGVLLTLLQFWVAAPHPRGQPGGWQASRGDLPARDRAGRARRRDRADGRKARRLTEPLRNFCFSSTGHIGSRR